MAAAKARTKDAPQAPPQYDAYFGVLVVSTVALICALVFCYADYSGYNPAPKALQKTVDGAGFGCGAHAPGAQGLGEKKGG